MPLIGGDRTKIEVIGTGCPNCKKTLANVEKAVEVLRVQAEVLKVYDPIEIAKRGLLETPAVAIDGTVRIAGRVPTVDELKQILTA